MKPAPGAHSLVNTLLGLIRSAADAGQQEHERAFLARYASLRTYARRLTHDGHQSADDLLQEAFIQFTISRPDLAAINNLDAYLTTLVRNVHVSQARRAARRKFDVSIEEYDSADFALTLTDGEERLLARDGLRRVAQYVCVRKESSKAASILAMRFFHGIYRAEIASIVRCGERAVDRLLWQARNEARLFMTQPERIRVLGTGPARPSPLPTLPSSNDPAEIAASLRAAFFATVQPPCLDEGEVDRWYSGRQRVSFDAPLLSHIVSCPTCLDRVCAAAGTPPDTSAPEDRGPGLVSEDCSSPSARLSNAVRRRRRDLLEHRPKELRVSVNGLHIGALAVESARNRVRWTLRPEEPLAFAELHSEQGARMALLNIAPASAGELLQQVRVELTDHREVELSIDLSGDRPIILVEYSDPSLLPPDVPSHASTLQPAESRMPAGALETATEAASAWRWASLFSARFLRLAPIALVLAVSVSALAWWVVNRRSSGSNPALVLERAVAADVETRLPPERAIHRTLRFEVRRADTSAVQAVHRIEAWRQGASRLRAVRIFDQAGHMVGGRWIDADGRENTLSLGIFDDVWQADLSPQVFSERYARGRACAVVRDARTISVTCVRPARTGFLNAVFPRALAADASMATDPLSARLTLRRADLQATRLALTVRVGDVDEQVAIEEQASEIVPTANVPAGIFSAPSVERPHAALSAAGPRRARATASPSLEMRLLELVDRFAVRDYVSIDRTGSDSLGVKGLVGSAEQKRALLEAVAALGAGDALKADLLTFAEAASLESSDPRRTSSRTARAELRTLPTGPAPIERYLRGRMSGPGADSVLRDLTPRVLDQSRAVRREASTLASLLDRFPEAVAASLDPDGRAAWGAMIVRHAAECLHALEALDRTLAPYFPRDDDPPVFESDSLTPAVGRLANASTTIDDLINRAFTASDEVRDSDDIVAIDLRTHIQRARLDAQFIERGGRR